MNTEKTVSFITLGCKVNQYDSDAMRTLFVDGGYSQVEDYKNADVYVINTCSVTSIGDRKSRQMVRRIRRQHPDAVIAVAGCYAQLAPEVFEKMGDVGFPGETEELFQKTLETLKELKFSGIHVFPYSKRTGTPAAGYPNQVPNEIKKQRVHRVQELEKEISREYRARFMGKTVCVLAEEVKDGYFEGLTEEYIRVSIRSQGVERGGMYNVLIDTMTDDGLSGVLAKEE